MKRTLLLTIALLLGLASAAWADDIHMKAAPTNPAAYGTVSVEHDRNGNIEMKIRVHHLAQPGAVDTATTTYVVWIQPKDRPADNVGVMRVDKNLNGEFKATTPHQKFDVFITAETTPRPDQPTGPEVLRASVDK